MISQNLVLELMAKTSQAAVEGRKNDAIGKGAFPQFQDTLRKAMNRDEFAKISSQNNYRTVKRRDSQLKQSGNAGMTEDAGKSIKNNKMASSVMHRSVKSEVNSSGIDENTRVEKSDGVDEKTESPEMKDEVLINSLAQLLGISSADFIEILEMKGIKVKAATEGIDAGKLVNALTEFAGLNTQEQETLAKLVGLLNNRIENALSQPEHAEGKEQQVSQIVLSDAEKESGLQSKVAASSEGMDEDPEAVGSKQLKLSETRNAQLLGNKSADMDIIQEIKSKLEVISKEMKESNQTFAAELNKKVEVVLAEYNADESSQSLKGLNNAKSPEINPFEQFADEQEQQKHIIVQEAQNGSTSENGKGDSEGKSGFGNSLITAAGQGENGKKPKTQVAVEENYASIASNQTVKDESTNEVVKLQKDVHVPKEEIVKQVVEKAKVVLSSDKSEMVMNLKPDNLGKLSLKVVTERGIVMAKFVAESEQVKAVLEANMQLLKDSLEKQGFSVQGFSVSVGQDMSKGFNKDDGYAQTSSYGTSKLDFSSRRGASTVVSVTVCSKI